MVSIIMEKGNVLDNDFQLVERFRKGDQRAFDELVIKYQSRICYLVLGIIGDSDEAADIAQTTFVKAYQKLHSFRGKASFKTWLYRIAINLSKNYLREKVKKERLPPLRKAERVIENKVEEMIIKERSQMVREAISQLPERQRLTLLLRIYEELPYKEIARIMGGPAGLAKVNFHHAINNLRKKWRKLNSSYY